MPATLTITPWPDPLLDTTEAGISRVLLTGYAERGDVSRSNGENITASLSAEPVRRVQ